MFIWVYLSCRVSKFDHISAVMPGLETRRLSLPRYWARGPNRREGFSSLQFFNSAGVREFVINSKVVTRFNCRLFCLIQNKALYDQESLAPSEAVHWVQGSCPSLVLPNRSGPCLVAVPTLLTCLALPLAFGVPATSAWLRRASFMSHLLAPQLCRAGPSPWLSLWYGMVSHWLSGHFLGYSVRNSFSNLKQHYSAMLGLGALLSRPTWRDAI